MTAQAKYVCLTCYVRQLRDEQANAASAPTLVFATDDEFRAHLDGNPGHVLAPCAVAE